ncbi:MAG TPA: 3-hydroxyacyl-CoA dehydrogenase [Stellaceae bacterium]|nr:3-hydroxyacyl-CoA dehydrogenase [Stellaceae bacterium]
MTDPDTLGVVGAGIMGAGIAQTAVAAGYRVILSDTRPEALAAAREGIRGRLARLVEKGQLAAEIVEALDARLSTSEDLASLRPAGVVIEAIVEDLGAKRALFAALEAIVDDETILATNTSSLAVAAIARDCRRRDRVCGLHFFNPVPVMRLVEVIGAPATAPATLERATETVVRFGKTPVRVKDSPGFLVNLCGRAYTTEALHIVQEGAATVEQVDTVMRDGWGFRMGPFELLDLTGIDVNFPVTSHIWHGFQDDPRLKTTPLHESMFDAGLFGRKVGIGFHSYGGSPAKAPEPPAAGEPVELRAFVPEPGAASNLRGLRLSEQDDGDSPILLFPDGEDATTAACRLGIDAARAVAVDLSCRARGIVTVMKPPGTRRDGIAAVSAWLASQSLRVVEIQDSPGFIAPRLLAMIANLGCEVAQIGLATPDDIDLAVRLGLNYPQGPLELAELLGPTAVMRVLTGIAAVTGSDRYRPSLWLRRRAMLGLPIRTPG